MKGNVIKLIVVYLIVKVIGQITGLSYNVFFAEEFDIIKLLIDISIWVITYFVVDMAFSKLEKKNKC